MTNPVKIFFSFHDSMQYCKHPCHHNQQVHDFTKQLCRSTYKLNKTKIMFILWNFVKFDLYVSKFCKVFFPQNKQHIKWVRKWLSLWLSCKNTQQSCRPGNSRGRRNWNKASKWSTEKELYTERKRGRRRSYCCSLSGMDQGEHPPLGV